MRLADLGGAAASPRRGRRAPAPGRGTAVLISAVLGTAAIVAVAATVATAVTMARRVVTPVRERPEDIVVHGLERDAVTLSRTADTVLPGRYGLWFDGDQGHARLGRILREDDRTVTRVVESVQHGELARARTARIGGAFYAGPGDVGAVERELSIRTPVGDAPAWFVPGANDGSGHGEDWIIHVHGRGATRAEGLRAVPLTRELGWASLLMSYRNDGDAPPSADGRYALGAAEWRDLEAAVARAHEEGARRIVVMGWSMGGAITLQFLVRSPLASRVVGVVLESPVIDWVTVLRFHAGLAHVPRPVGEAALALLGAPAAAPLLGREDAIDLASLDLVARADELRVPALILHSDDDGYVPIDASLALAAARPDLVTLERFALAGHTRLWNLDPERWEGVISRWLRQLDEPTARTARPRRRSAAAAAPID